GASPKRCTSKKMTKNLSFEARFFLYMEKPPEAKKTRLESVRSTQRVIQEARYGLSVKTRKPC
ncbi:MAG: hypothetical protein AB9903_30610, partial [Vulcanimicrobiota bacterium]